MNKLSADYYAKAMAVASDAVMQFMKANKPEFAGSSGMIAVDAVNKGLASRPLQSEMRQNPDSGTYELNETSNIDWLAVALSTAAFGYTIYHITKHLTK
jgi:hypothetical protein